MDPLAARFSDVPDLILDASRTEACERLQYVVEHHSCGVLTGPAGSGKSTLLKQLLPTLRRAGRRTVFLDLIGADSREFLRTLGAEIGLGISQKASSSELRSRLFDFATSASESDRPLVLILDHLDRAEPHCIKELERFRHLLGNRATLLISTRPECSEPLRSLCRQWATLRIEIAPLSRDQLIRKIPQFSPRANLSPAASVLLADAADGRVDRFRQLCELLDLAVVGDHPQQIDAEFVQAMLTETV